MESNLVATLTLNPALDLSLHVDTLRLGEVHRAVSSRLDPGGKGINVSRVLHGLGIKTRTLALLGGQSGETLARMLHSRGLDIETIPGPGETRTNVAITEPDGRQTKVNQSGPIVDDETADRIRQAVREVSKSLKYLVMSGRLPPGLPDNFYGELIRISSEEGACAVLDADGSALAEGIKAGPFLIKPNRRELEDLAGRSLPGEKDVLQAAQELNIRGVGAVIVSLGSEGAIAVSKGTAWKGRPPKVQVQNEVGLGDSLVAGVVYQLARGAAWPEALRWGIAAGAASAAAPPVTLCGYQEVAAMAEKVAVEVISDK